MPIRNATTNETEVGVGAVALAPATRTGSRVEPAGLHWTRAAVTVGVLGAVATLLWWKAIPCGFAALTHLPCPGCGSTRATLALAHGDFAGLFQYNPFGPAMALLMLLLALKAVSSVLLRGDFSAMTDGRSGALISRGVMILATLEIVLWVARFFGALGGPVPL